MKIIFIGTVASSIYGFRYELIQELIKSGYQIFAMVSEYSDQELNKIYQMGITPIPYDLNRGGINPFADLLATYKMLKKIKEINPDIVFSYFSKPVIFGTLAAKIAKVPRVVGMLEGLGYPFTEQPEGTSIKSNLIKKIQILLYKIALPKLDNIILLNNDDYKDLIVKYSIKVKDIHILGGIGVDLNKYPHHPFNEINDPIHFLFIGRLLKEKGIFDFIEAAKIVQQQFPNVKFTVLGSFDHANLGSKSNLKELISSNIIEYHGQVDNIVDWIKSSHVFVLPSYREGVPRSTQEAMAVGRAIITTDVPGCRDTVIDGVNGFLVRKWSPQLLANKMIFLIQNPHTIITMGNHSHDIAIEKYDIHKINKKLIKFILGN